MKEIKLTKGQVAFVDVELKKCWWFTHIWDRWETIEKGQNMRGDDVIGRYLIQQRECKDCGKKQLNQTYS